MAPQRIASVLKLTGGDIRLLVTALTLVGLIRLGLWVLPFRTLNNLIVARLRVKSGTRVSEQRRRQQVSRVVWAVKRASRLVPAATCLTQALATVAMTAMQGQRTHLRIGVCKAEGGGFEAHAWAEYEGRIVIGRIPNLGRYTPLGATRGFTA